MGSEKTNKKLAQRFYDEVLNEGKFDLIDETVADDFVDHSSASPGPGRAGMREMISMYRSAFPDLRFTAEEMIAEGEVLVIRYVMTGTHQGDFMGVPATNKKVNMRGVDIVRFAGGKAVEHWEFMDELGMMKQLGAVKMMEPASQAG